MLWAVKYDTIEMIKFTIFISLAFFFVHMDKNRETLHRDVFLHFTVKLYIKPSPSL